MGELVLVGTTDFTLCRAVGLTDGKSDATLGRVKIAEGTLLIAGVVEGLDEVIEGAMEPTTGGNETVGTLEGDWDGLIDAALGTLAMEGALDGGVGFALEFPLLTDGEMEVAVGLEDFFVDG